MADLKALREERAKLVQDARAVIEAAGDEVGAEAQAQFDALIARAEDRGRVIAREEQLRDLERAAALRQDEEDRGRGRTTAGGDKAEAFGKWLRTGRMSHQLETRALQADDGDDGGYIVAPQTFVSNLIKFVDDQVFIRNLASKYQIATAGSMGAAELTADPADADWTTELQTGGEDSTMKFGKRELYPHPMAKRIKISKDLIRKSVIGVEQLVQQRLGYKFAVTEEKAFMTGTGDKQPLGVFTASASGISTARDVSTGNTTTEIKADNLIEVKYKLKAQYMRTAVWVFHRDGMKQIAKLKDGEGQYLFRVSLTELEPDRLLGRPLYMSEYAPSTFTTGLYVGIFGDFSHYWIADALDMQMQRLDELYAETNQVGFIARRETDGAPVLAEAFARVKLA